MNKREFLKAMQNGEVNEVTLIPTPYKYKRKSGIGYVIKVHSQSGEHIMTHARFKFTNKVYTSIDRAVQALSNMGYNGNTNIGGLNHE